MTVEEHQERRKQIERLEGAIRSAIDMIDNCTGVPTNPDGLPQMLKAHLNAAL